MEGEGGLRAEVAFGDGGVDLVGVAGQGDGDVEAERGDQVRVVGVDGGEDGEFVGAGQVGEGLGGVGDLGRAGQRQPGVLGGLEAVDHDEGQARQVRDAFCDRVCGQVGTVVDVERGLGQVVVEGCGVVLFGGGEAAGSQAAVVDGQVCGDDACGDVGAGESGGGVQDGLVLVEGAGAGGGGGDQAGSGARGGGDEVEAAGLESAEDVVQGADAGRQAHQGCGCGGFAGGGGGREDGVEGLGERGQASRGARRSDGWAAGWEGGLVAGAGHCGSGGRRARLGRGRGGLGRAVGGVSGWRSAGAAGLGSAAAGEPVGAVGGAGVVPGEAGGVSASAGVS